MTITRDDVKCRCVGPLGPNPECGACGGSGCVTAEVPTPPDLIQAARKIAAATAREEGLHALAPQIERGERDDHWGVKAALRALQAPHQGLKDGRRPEGASRHGLSPSYQDRSAALMGVAFADDPTDRAERRDRTAEEDCEAYQADGGTLDDWIAIGRYTFGRPAGTLPKEIGQKVFTLACWAAFRGIDMMAEAERELARCSTPEFIDKLARKRATRHGRGPLPGFSGPETSDPGIAHPAPTTGGEAPGRDERDPKAEPWPDEPWESLSYYRQQDVKGWYQNRDPQRRSLEGEPVERAIRQKGRV